MGQIWVVILCGDLMSSRIAGRQEEPRTSAPIMRNKPGKFKMDIVSADLQKRAQTKADTRSEKVARRKAQEEVR